jgi:hypothetical protein
VRLKTWWQWVKSKPLYLRWFILVLLIRPIAEQFYELKDVSPILSPLYWLGTLTLLFSIIGIIRGNKIKSKLDNTFLIWSLLAFFSVIALFFSSSGLMNFLNFGIKLTIPFLVYYFLRMFIHEKSDFVGLTTTFLFSCIYPMASMILGISTGLYSGEGRFAGSYADVFSNAFYLSFGAMALLYHYILSKTYYWTFPVNNYLIILAIIIAILGLWVIKHMATIAVFIGFIVVFIYVVYRRRREAAMLLIFLSVIFILFAGNRFYDEVMNPRLEKEVEVIQGIRDIDQALHGRMSRWTWLMDDFRQAPFYAQLAGYPLSLNYSTHMIAITPHNDFLRIMFFTGYFGLLIYIILVVKVFFRGKHLDTPDRFLVYAVLLSTLLYSVSTVPTFYPNFVNILMIIFAYTALPPYKQIPVGKT